VSKRRFRIAAVDLVEVRSDDLSEGFPATHDATAARCRGECRHDGGRTDDEIVRMTYEWSAISGSRCDS